MDTGLLFEPLRAALENQFLSGGVTEMLIKAEEGRLLSFLASAQMSGGRVEVWGTDCENKYAAAGHMIFAALRRLGFVTRKEIEERLGEIE
ncbi:MAG: hypothetical protein M3416_01390 [Acidobacteriota bacterium]|nr:hypothetical protein [Acidobacteriota bacterium]